MPPRKRHKLAEEHRDPVVRFAEAVARSDQRRRAAEEKAAAERKEAQRLAQLAAEHAEAMRAAQAGLDRAIEAAKQARSTGKGVAEADAAWRAAKARLIELETGQPPAWAGPGTADEPPQGDPAGEAHS